MQREQGIIRASGRDRVVRGVYCGCARVACLLCTVPRCPRTEADAHKEVLLSKRERGGEGIRGMRSLRVIQSISTLICNFLIFAATYVRGTSVVTGGGWADEIQ